MRIHVVSETPFLMQGNGVHTAFRDQLELLRSKEDLEVVVNGEGHGDVFHGHTYGPYYFLKGLRYRGRRVHTVHVTPDSIKGSLPAWPFWMPLVKAYLKRVYSFADVCIAISPQVEDAIRALNADTEIVRLPNPIMKEHWKRTPERRRLGREMLGLDPEAFVVLGVGQLQGRKGVEDFIDMADALPEASFVWAGGRPFKTLTEGIDRIDARIAAAPGNIQFTGMLDLEIMPLVYAAADVMLFTSFQENCPMAPLEAAASGIPVVFRNLPEYKRLYEQYYLSAEDTADFIGKTRRLMLDERYYATGQIISANLLFSFDAETIRRRQVALYERLAHRMTGRSGFATQLVRGI